MPETRAPGREFGMDRPDGSFSGDLDGQAVLGHTGDSRALRDLPREPGCAGSAGARNTDYSDGLAGQPRAPRAGLPARAAHTAR